MRTFIAIPLPVPCRTLLEDIQSKLRPFGADVRWTAIASIHLTLKFLGEIDRSMLPRLTSALNEHAKTPGFDLRMRGLGGFPDLHRPRVIWCGIEGQVDSLTRLQKAVETACQAVGFAREDRPFHPHLTLGRVQGKRNLQLLLDYIRIGSEGECGFAVDHYNVYQSVLTPCGANYTILEKIPLLQPSHGPTA